MKKRDIPYALLYLLALLLTCGDISRAQTKPNRNSIPKKYFEISEKVIRPNELDTNKNSGKVIYFTVLDTSIYAARYIVSYISNPPCFFHRDKKVRVDGLSLPYYEDAAKDTVQFYEVTLKITDTKLKKNASGRERMQTLRVYNISCTPSSDECGECIKAAKN